MESVNPVAASIEALVPVGTAVVGGAIALFVSRLAGRDARRLATEQARAQVRSDQASALSDWVRHAASMVADPSGGRDFEVARGYTGNAFTRFALTLSLEEAPLERILAGVANAAHEPAGPLMLTSAQNALHRWYRGELSPEDALREYARQTAALARQMKVDLPEPD